MIGMTEMALVRCCLFTVKIAKVGSLRTQEQYPIYTNPKSANYLKRRIQIGLLGLSNISDLHKSDFFNFEQSMRLCSMLTRPSWVWLVNRLANLGFIGSRIKIGSRTMHHRIFLDGASHSNRLRVV